MPATSYELLLPAEPTGFIGRETERATVIARLADPACRLVSLIGVGGVGKTRLALEAAQALAANSTLFPDGVIFVALATIDPVVSAADALAAAVAEALGLTGADPEPPQARLVTYLRPRTTLIILDNFEHLLDARSYLADLLAAAPTLKIIITSRERLHLRAEWVVALDGLACPALGDSSPSFEAFPALQLFAQAARQHVPGFTVNTTYLPAVAWICQLVDGLPLGIELAASWVRLLDPKAIAAEIARSLDFLASSAPDLPARQQSLRAVFDHSWGLLAAPERRALRRLAVFAGPFTREAAAAVAGVGLPEIGSLLDRALIRRADGAAGPRFELLETVRQYAANRLEEAGEAAELSARHTAYYADMLAARVPDLRGAGQQAALEAIGAEIAQVRAAWSRAVAAADQAAIDRAADGLFHFYDMRSRFHEGAVAFASAAAALAALPDPPTAALGRALARQGWFTFHQGRQREARDLLDRGRALLSAAGARDQLGFTLNYLASVCAYLGDYQATRAHGAESLALASELADDYCRAVACNILGQAAYDQGDYEAARSWSQQSYAIEQRIGNRWSMAYSLINLGKVAFVTGDYAAAQQLFSEALTIRSAIGDTRGVAHCFSRLGDTALAANRHSEAQARYAEALAQFRSIGDRWGEAAAQINLGHLARLALQERPAARHYAEALRLALATGAQPQQEAVLMAAMPLAQAAGEPWAAAFERQLEQLANAPAERLALIEKLQVWLATYGHDAVLVLAEHTPPPPVSRPDPSFATGYPGGLTPREVEVLRLVAEGLTDAQVAERLIISKRTVSTHLSTIYSKLQVASRSAATRFAVEHGIV